MLRRGRLRRPSRRRHVMALTAMTPWRGSQAEGFGADSLSLQCFVYVEFCCIIASLLVAVHDPSVAAVLVQCQDSSIDFSEVTSVRSIGAGSA